MRAGSAPLTAGVTVVDITPPVGYRMAGYFSERLSTGAKNPLHAKALVLRQGDERAALVFCDLIGVPQATTDDVRRRAAERTGIPAANILIAATHTHTGPLYFGIKRDFLHEQAVARTHRDPHEAVDYPAALTDAIVKAIAQADAAAAPVRLEAGAVEQQGLALNRRFLMKDGTARFNPGPNNPDVVGPAGPTDPQVGVVSIRSAAGGEPAAALVNFAMHLDTVGGTEYAADYPFYVEQTLQAAFGKNFTLLFGTGTCGDINHVGNRPTRPTTETIGRTLGDTVRNALPRLRPVAPALAVRRETVTVPLQRTTREDLARARQESAKFGTKDLPTVKAAEVFRILDLAAMKSDTVTLEVQVFRLGNDVAVVGLPGEVFVELGLAIKRASPFATTLVIELSNDAPAYIPTEKAFKEGSYEVVNSRIAPGGGEKLVEAAVRLLKELGEK